MEEAANITEISTQEAQEEAAYSMAVIKKLMNGIEASRTEIKKPVLDLGKRIDALAKIAVDELRSESGRLARLVATFEDEKRKKAAEEAAKLRAEIERIEAEKRKVAEEQERKQREAQEAASKAKSEAERRRLEEVAEKLKIEGEKKKLDAAQQQLALSAKPIEKKTKGVTLRTVPHFEILNINELHKAKPLYCRIEPNAELINTAILRGEMDFPGLRCWTTKEAGVRA
ncbi:MAG: hypothetical protein PHV34_05935 [Verrucomicrobiae bacterium]|nr:hypothetical protein [Verrucomicrobiae bacterium]